MAWAEFTNKDSQYVTPEFELFFENYCKEKNITIQQVIEDADHFDIVCSLFDESLNKK